MISVLPQKSTTKSERGSGRRAPSPDELYSTGYRDGLNGRTQHPQFRHRLEYLEGYNAGYRARPNSLFQLPATPQATLERGWGDERLNEAA